MTILRLTVDGETHELDMTRILNTEAIAAQKVTGLTWDQMLTKCDDGDAEAISALVWIAVKRAHPELRFKDLSFPLREVWGGREFIDTDDASDEGDDDVDPPKPEGAGSESA
jgi:hypothetical protein